jgi:hypothetical protein
MLMITLLGISGKNNLAKSLIRVSYKVMPRSGMRGIQVQGLMWGLLRWRISLKHSPEQNENFLEFQALWGVIRGW